MLLRCSRGGYIRVANSRGSETIYGCSARLADMNFDEGRPDNPFDNQKLSVISLTVHGVVFSQVENSWSDDDSGGPTDNVQIWVNPTGEECKLIISNPSIEFKDSMYTTAFLQIMQDELERHGSKSIASSAAAKTRSIPILPAGETLIVNRLPVSTNVLDLGRIKIYGTQGIKSSLTLITSIAGPFEITG